MFCFIYKWLISDCLDSEKKPDGQLAAHIAKCTKCSAFYLNSASLPDKLRFKPRPSAGDLSSKVQATIIEHALRAGQAAVPDQTKRFPRLAISLAATLLILLSAVATLSIIKDRSTTLPRSASDYSSVPYNAQDTLLSAMLDVDSPIFATLTPLFADHTADIQLDAKSAINFATGFLDF